MVGGQVGIVGHLNLADGIKIAAQSGIQYSVEEENLEIVKFLISKGANPYLPDNEGISSFHKAKMKPEILKVLKQSEHTSAPPKHRFAIKEKYKKHYGDFALIVNISSSSFDGDGGWTSFQYSVLVMTGEIVDMSESCFLLHRN